MSDKNYRFQRVERLLMELEYEITRGMIEGELDETIGFEFVVPISKSIPNGIVMCSFKTRPQLQYFTNYDEPRLKAVK